MGCYAFTSPKTLNITTYLPNDNTPEFCASYCNSQDESYNYFGVYNYRYCACGLALPEVEHDAYVCDYYCIADSRKTCGDHARNSVYRYDKKPGNFRTNMQKLAR